MFDFEGGKTVAEPFPVTSEIMCSATFYTGKCSKWTPPPPTLAVHGAEARQNRCRGHHENTVQSAHLFGLIGFCIIRLWLCVSLVFFQTVNRHFIDTNINGDQPSPSPSPFPPPPPPYSPSMHTTCVSHKFIRNVQLFIFLIRHLETRT